MASKRKSAVHAVPARQWAVHLTVESKKLRVPSAWIKKTVKAVLEYAERDIFIPEVCEIHVVITDDKRIKVINREFRKKDKATDVRPISGRSGHCDGDNAETGREFRCDNARGAAQVDRARDSTFMRLRS